MILAWLSRRVWRLFGAFEVDEALLDAMDAAIAEDGAAWEAGRV